VRGERMGTKVLESLFEGVFMALRTGFRGVEGLWVLGAPYIMPGDEPET